MSYLLCTGGILTCPFGSLPAAFSASPLAGVVTAGRPAGALCDITPIIQIPSFGLCSSLSNPTVASATSAAMGVLTPMPCAPVPAGFWSNPSTDVLIGGNPALTDASKLSCAWGGQIRVQFAGQTGVQ